MATPTDVARVLLARAVDDHAMAEDLAPSTRIPDAGIGFHAQQSVEKSVKAVLAFNGVRFPYSHDLHELIELCEENGIKIPAALSSVDDLSPYAVELRYDEPAPSGVDRSEGIEWAAEAIAWARGIVEPEPQPPAETDSASSDTN
jgi:HEPN domain-containing protein